MEVVAASPGTPGGGVPPFHDHDVREWSRIDSLTGVLERARLETDHWTANTSTSCHKYGKVVDSRARTNADGALQQQARRQLEVFQSQVPGGHLQVIKTQTVSSSRWSSNAKAEVQELPIKDFESLQLSVNPLDLSSQKSKANVGRGVGRRPPSRPRAREESIRRVSRLCHQIHEQQQQTSVANKKVNGHHHLTRTKSTSSEDLHLEDKSTKSTEDLEDLEQLQTWRRSSKLRRSLQYPKPAQSTTATKPASDLPENCGSVRKIREELEKGRRLSTALRNNSVDLEALDQILQTISSSSSNQSDKPATADVEDPPLQKQKRNSFVTVETLQEVRGRLRRTSTPTEDATGKEEETDDGIVTEEGTEMPVTADRSRVRSYVYGMEAMMKKKPMLGTGSLESRSKLLNGTTNLRNEDWYNRRKSYGFEQVHNHTESPNPISLRSKCRVESSTDSGICRSSEIVIVPTTKSDTNCDEKNFTSVKQISSIFDHQSFNKDLKSTTITIPILSKPNSTNIVELSWDEVPEKEAKRHSIAVDESKYVTGQNDSKFRKVINPTLEDQNQNNRKSKKVEFCKTEVHFAAESGKVNIVETDEKPPPTNNFRRRRRNSGPIIIGEDFERNGLPVLHFGDTSYEKVLLGVTDNEANIESMNDDGLHQVSCGTVTVNTATNPVELQEEDRKECVENVKGILKNKPIKPTPYHLGEDYFLNNSNSDSDSGKWGVRLKPVQKSDPPPYWKSTVTLHNTIYGQEQAEDEDEQPEFQKLLRNLRPTGGNRPDLISDQRNGDSFSNIKFITSSDGRRSWSVADKVRLSEENKVYSTKVNFGDGGTAVVENDRFGHKEQPPWKKENPVKDDCSEPATYKYGIEESLSNFDNDHSDSKLYKTKKEGQYSTIITRKTSSLAKRSDLRTASASEKLSSPSLVGRSTKLDLHSDKYSKESEFLNVTDVRLHQKLATNEIVLRQPKKSEMTYFGVSVSPRPTKKIVETVIHQETKISVKPDLLQHMKTDSPSSRTRFHSPQKTNNSPCSRTRHRSPDKESSPVYENVQKNKINGRNVREFDKKILEELTKAADQILQAVNGFSEDEQIKQSGDERHAKEPLDTITESKSWSQDKLVKTTSSKQNSTKLKLKHTSSTSSVESLSKDRKLSQSKMKPVQGTQTKKKLVSNETNATRATTKARRLQRASSREALLQSHGSSSEDLGTSVEVPHRKPRQIKKTKLSQLSVTNGIEIKNKTPPNPPRRRRDESKDRLEHLQEIRHKTAVSTIRSTAEKSSRDRSKARIDESKKKVPQKRDSSRGSSSKTTELKKTVSSREISNHRISTASIKKCHRADGGSRH